jgi:hypothetical protein
VDPHFKGEKYLGSANGDFYANAPMRRTAAKQKPAEAGLRNSEPGADSVQGLTRTQLRG